MQLARIIDAHVHGFPDRLFDAVWAFFMKNYWPIKYKLHASEIALFLKSKGVLHYTVLNYAHKPGISRDMNTWTHEFSLAHPEALCFGTIHPDDPYMVEELERALSPGQLDLRGLKIQLLVTNFDPGIRALDAMYETLVQHGKILVMHSGTGPGANEHVGIRKLRPVMERYPALHLQVPHLGSFEYKEFFDLARDYKNVYFDTAMIMIKHRLFPDKFGKAFTVDDLLGIQDRVMFGSDFPNIPYDYDLAINSITSLPASEAVREKMLWRNAARFYGLDEVPVRDGNADYHGNIIE
ncbi:MAG: amidohydrolase [Candidatus Lokiarchaeota archaeon]|nr:amidohydrolase [Candidatus Lokiarchaeota archaeon]